MSDRILKNGEVEIEGRLTLDLGHAGQPGHNRPAPTGQASVRVLENQNEYAVMEVACCCGRKTVIRCDYGGTQAVKNAKARPEPR